MGALHSITWYNWSIKNQKIYLTMVTFGRKKVEINMGMVVKLNFDLLKSVSPPRLCLVIVTLKDS